MRRMSSRIRLSRACGLKLATLVCIDNSFLIRLSRACGLKHQWAAWCLEWAGDQALASLRIETYLAFCKFFWEFDQALASLRIETIGTSAAGLTGWIRLSRACGLKHSQGPLPMTMHYDQALASLRIETLQQQSLLPQTLDQALASLRIETFPVYCRRHLPAIRLSRACGLKHKLWVEGPQGHPIRLSRACGLKFQYWNLHRVGLM